MNYAVGGKCYAENVAGVSADSIAKNCATYGRLYNWETAVALPNCNTTSCSGQINQPHQGVCPAGWHLPSNAEWDALMQFVNPSCTATGDCAGAGTLLKAVDGWNGNLVSTDIHDFSALPGGYCGSGGSFGNVGYVGNWWSATENNSINAWSRSMTYNGSGVGRYDNGKSFLFSVRCLQD